MAWREFGKKTVVLETGWINNVNDADGTGNSISANDEIQAYSHDPQGQVNAIEDMYKALVTQGGVGGFLIKLVGKIGTIIRKCLMYMEPVGHQRMQLVMLQIQ